MLALGFFIVLLANFRALNGQKIGGKIMPIYIYKHPEHEEYEEVFQGMNDKHEYTDEFGTKWERVFLAPNAMVDSDIDPFSEQSFLDKTKNAGTVGDLWDRGAEMSHKRAMKNDGVDPLRNQYFKDYSKARKGAKHHLDN